MKLEVHVEGENFMPKKVRSVKNFWGETVHYDEHGKKIGVSRPNFWGGTNHYDASGDKVGESHKNFWGGETHRDTHGNKVGESHGNFWEALRIVTTTAIKSVKPENPSGAAQKRILMINPQSGRAL